MVIGIDASRAMTAQQTGTETYAFFLLQALIPLAIAKGHKVRLYVNKPVSDGFPAWVQSTDIVAIPFPRLWTHVRLAWELYRHPPDVFFTPAHVIPATYLGAAVATVHDLGYHYFPEAHPKHQLLYLKWSTRHNGRRSRLVLTDSQATKADLVKLDGIAPDKIEVVYPGLDVSLQRATAEEITAVLARYHITLPYLLYLSTLQPRKNLVRLVRAYAAADLPHQLVLAGKPGWLAAPILQEIAQLPPSVARKILLPGYIPNHDKAALLSGATALLYPSLYEGFGFPALEAQVCETAVLCANSSSLPEIVADGALLVDPLNTTNLTTAMQQIATDAPLRQRLIQQGRKNVKRFSWEKTAEQVLTLLERAVH